VIPGMIIGAEMYMVLRAALWVRYGSDRGLQP